MAIIKVFLDPGETEDQAKDLLFKALKAQSSPSNHTAEAFAQPAAQAVVEAMEAAHTKMWSKMMAEIEEVLSEELS